MKTNETYTPSKVNRRGVLGRLLLLTAGAVGAGGAAGVASSEARTSPAKARAPRKLTVYAANLRVGPVASRERQPAAPAPSVPFGDLLNARGKRIGSFQGVALSGHGGEMHLHTFDLGDGMILGLGSGGLEGSAYAIVGGTGRYAGATGAYAIRPANGLPGRSAEFTFTLQAWEA